MKVLQINAVYGYGSTGVIAKEILDEVISAGGEAYAAFMKHRHTTDISSLSGYIEIGNKADQITHTIQSRFLGEQGFYSNKATRKMLSEIDEIKPDIIHVHNLHNNYMNIELLFNYVREKKIPTVITLHDAWFFTGKCCHFLYDGCNRWKEKCGECPRQRKEFVSLFFDKSEKDLIRKRKLIGENPYVYVVGCSNWLTSCAKASILRSRVICTINNGIDLSIFSPKESCLREQLGLEKKKVILGMANKWLSQDNENTYEYITANMDKDCVLVLLGCNKGQIESNKKKNVITIGFINDRTELACYYSIADVFANVTKVDSFPTVNLEAIACGTPVVTYNSGGSAETVDSDTGAVVDYGDYISLLQQLNRILNDGKLKYRDRCTERARKFYDKKEKFQEYLGLYKEILENNI